MEGIQVRQDASKVILIGISLIFARLVLPSKTYNRYVYKMLCSLSPTGISIHAVNFIDTMKFAKKDCVNFRNSDYQTDTMLKKMTLLKPYYRHVCKIVRSYRLKYRLMP